MAFSWTHFWNNLKKLGDDAEKVNKKNNVKDWSDTEHYNPLDIVVKKLKILVNDEATFKFDSDSAVAEPLRSLCADLENKRYEICSVMLGKGGCFVTLATGADGMYYHRIISPDDVSIYRTAADKIYEAAAVIDRKTVKQRRYSLIRHHSLDENGTLTIRYYTVNESGAFVYFEPWEHYKNGDVAFRNAGHIGITYFKSPQDSNGHESFFGVPLNYACADEEKHLTEARNMLRSEMEHAQIRLFPDESITQTDTSENKKTRFNLPERVYPIRKKAGIDGNLIDSFAPSTRQADYERQFIVAGREYENRIGLNAGFITPPEHTDNATATEIKNSNIKTISMIKNVQKAMSQGVLDALASDGIMLNIRRELWSVFIEWFNPFENEETQWTRLKELHDKGGASIKRLMKWVNPEMSDEDIENELEEISGEKQVSYNSAIMQALNM